MLEGGRAKTMRPREHWRRMPILGMIRESCDSFIGDTR